MTQIHIARSMALSACLALLTACTPNYEQHTREVTATAYTLRAVETRPQGKPGVAAWGHKLHPESQAIAVSRDLLGVGLVRGTKVRIDGLDGEYVVRDKMNQRWKNRIDIFMGEDLHAALNWGKRSVTIHWQTKRKTDSQ